MQLCVAVVMRTGARWCLQCSSMIDAVSEFQVYGVVFKGVAQGPRAVAPELGALNVLAYSDIRPGAFCRPRCP